MASSPALKFARFSALAFALAACTWIVVRAHEEANPIGASASVGSQKSSPAADPETDEESQADAAGEQEPIFLPSTTAIRGGPGGGFRITEPRSAK